MIHLPYFLQHFRYCKFRAKIGIPVIQPDVDVSITWCRPDLERPRWVVRHKCQKKVTDATHKDLKIKPWGSVGYDLPPGGARGWQVGDAAFISCRRSRPNRYRLPLPRLPASSFSVPVPRPRHRRGQASFSSEPAPRRPHPLQVQASFS